MPPGESLHIVCFQQANWNAIVGQAPTLVAPNGHPGQCIRFTSDVCDVRDAFFRTRRQGMGMSQPLARAIVKSHNGYIWEENKTNGGGSSPFPALVLP